MQLGRLKDHLEKLRFFKAIVEAGSISRAAAHLAISQSSLSHSIMTLEEALEVRLLERKPRGVGLSEAGKILYDFAKRLELDVISVESRLHAPVAENSGHLRVATHETIAVHVWPQFLRALREKYPQIHVSLFSGRIDPIVEGVLNRDYHLSVTVEPLPHPKLEVTKLYSGGFGLFAAAKEKCQIFPQLRKAQISRSEIKDIPVMTDVHAHIKQGLPIPRYLSELQLGSPFLHEVNSFEAAIRLTAQGLGIAAIPIRNAQEAVSQKLVREIQVKGILQKNFGAYNICAAFRKDDSSINTIKTLVSELNSFFV